MRFKLILEPFGKSKTLPINYQYEFSAWIYKILHFGNPEFAEWLHSHGYMDGKKQFKLFTFSQLKPEKYSVKGDRLEIQSHQASIQVSFYMEEAVEPFITGLFRNQEFSIGDKISRVQFRVNCIEKLPEPVWLSPLDFRAESPVVISTREFETSRNATYLSPEDNGYADLFLKNLLTKYLAVMAQKSDSSQLITFGSLVANSFSLLGKPRSKVIKIKAGTPEETSVKGFLFDFRVTAPVELIKLGYYAGFGEKNSLGFGSVELK